MNDQEIRDRCCWKRCRAESDMILMGVGLCDEHYATTISTFKTNYEYAVDRVIPEAARAMREQNELNLRTKD